MADDDQDVIRIDDAVCVRAILITVARARKETTYSQLLGALGYRFTRPKMRALCRTLDAIDTAGRALAEPDLAVLVVREADRLPGQGWWVEQTRRLGYEGPWTGPSATGFVRDQQNFAFEYWSKMKSE